MPLQTPFAVFNLKMISGHIQAHFAAAVSPQWAISILLTLVPIICFLFVAKMYQHALKM